MSCSDVGAEREGARLIALADLQARTPILRRLVLHLVSCSSSFSDLPHRLGRSLKSPLLGLLLSPAEASWLATYDAAKAAGTLFGIDPSTMGTDGMPYYADGVDTSEAGICAWTCELRSPSPCPSSVSPESQSDIRKR